MVPFDWNLIRLYLHVLAAAIWVGGQITLAGLLPVVRKLGDDAPARVARGFNKIAWPAFGVLLVTGVWNVIVIDPGKRSTQYQVVLLVKLVVVALAGLGAAAHIVSRSKVVLAIGGMLVGLASLAALFLGVWLHG